MRPARRRDETALLMCLPAETILLLFCASQVTALREAAVERIQEAERQAAAPPAPAEELDMFA